MSANNIYVGIWTDHARGPFYGRTLTLRDAHAFVLVSFLAILITHTGARSFKIVKFVLHQSRDHETPRDGLARQQEVTLRNSETDMGTLPVLGWIAFRWRAAAPHAWRRSIPLMVLVAMHMSAYLAAGIAVSFVANGDDPFVRARAEDCGAWVLQDGTLASMVTWQRDSLRTTTAARAYVRMCYDGAETAAEMPSECRVLPRRRLHWTATHNDTCPFADGICLDGESAAYTADTGLQSSDELGINSPDPMQWQHRTTCAPLKMDGYTEVRSDGEFGENVTHYLYGPVRMLGNSTHSVSDWERVGGSRSFTLNHQTSIPWLPNGTFQLEPIAPLRRDDADVTLLFISAYGVEYYEREQSASGSPGGILTAPSHRRPDV